MGVTPDTKRPVEVVSTRSTSVETTWRPHPIAAKALRIAVVLTPVAASVGVIFLLNRALPSPRSWESFAALAVADIVVGLTVLFVANKIAMRMLPLATLLSLSLAFPDQAPKRFAIVLRANSTTRLRSQMAARRDDDADVAGALEDVLTYLAALSRHDRMTRGHCERVRAFVDLLAIRMDLSKADQERLRWAALFHDIGKLRVPGPILRKPGKPTDKEWDTLRRHPIDGGEIIRPLAFWLGEWADAVEQHHERFDGEGYPKGLAGSDISLGGRILAVADAYEVMITSRPYKRPVRPEAARRELVRYAGQQFDPDIVRDFLGISIGDLRKVMGPLGVLSQVPILATVPRAEALIEMAGRQTLGAVGTVAGTGAFVAAATLSPMALHSASSPMTHPPVHITATPQQGSGARGVPTVSPETPIQTVTSGPTNDGPAGSPPLNPTSGSSTKGSGGTTEPSPATAPAPAGEVPLPTTPHLPGVGSIGTNISIPSSAGTTAKSLALAAEDATSSAGTAVEGVASTAGSAAGDVASTTGSKVEGLVKGSDEHPLLPPTP
jgi:putative nucleotidyltransferase with HDIG domain